MGVNTPNSGDLCHRVTLQVRVAGIDQLGQESQSWADVAEVWAKVEPLRGNQFFAAAQMQSEVTTRITIRWRANVTPAMRAVWRGEPYGIHAVIDPLGQRQQLELMCTNRTGDGR